MVLGTLFGLQGILLWLRRGLVLAAGTLFWLTRTPCLACKYFTFLGDTLLEANCVIEVNCVVEVKPHLAAKSSGLRVSGLLFGPLRLFARALLKLV